MKIIPFVAFIGFVVTGLLAVFGEAHFLLPVAFWLMMGVWLYFRFDEERGRVRRLLDRIADEDR